VDEIAEAAKRYFTEKEEFRRLVRETADVTKLFSVAHEYFTDAPEIAEEALRRLLDIAPQNLDALKELADLEFSAGDFVEAYALLSKARRVSTTDRDVLYMLAILGYSPERSERVLEELLELYPDDEQGRARFEELRSQPNDEMRRRAVLPWPPGQHPPDSR